jgi:sporulation protein YlmC with PRC-barrel domain
MTNNFDDFQKFGTEQLVGKSLQTIAEATNYSKKSLENSSAFLEKLLGAKSLDAAIQIQSEYAKTFYAGFIAQATKMGELYSNFAKEALKPLKVATSLSTTHWLASDIYKADVYDNSEHKIGDVIDLVVDSNDDVTAAIIGVGGFLGVGQKDIWISFKKLKVATRDGKDWLVLNRTKDDLMRAPAYDKKTENRKDWLVLNRTKDDHLATGKKIVPQGQTA